MTPEQELSLIRQRLAADDDLAKAIASVAKRLADDELRHSYKTLDAAVLVRQTGIAEGIEKLAAAITKAPTSARPDQKPPR